MADVTRESLYDDLEIKLSELRVEYRRGEFMSKNAEPTDGMTEVHRYICWREWKHVEDKLMKLLKVCDDCGKLIFPEHHYDVCINCEGRR